MAHVKIKTQIEILDADGFLKRYNFKDTFTSTDEILCQQFDIAADGTQIIWDPTNWTGMQQTNFDRLILYANGTLDVEMTVNEGDANEELNSFRLVKDIPFILGADDAYYNHSASNIYGGTLDVIDKIRVDEPNSTAVKATLILVS